MSGQTFLLALGFAFMLEGALPLLVPAAWRRALSQLLQMQDGQIRFFGLLSVGFGLLVVALVA